MENPELEKEHKLESIRQEVSEIRDVDKNEVEPGIRDTIVFLKALGVNTLMSCAGHAGEDETWRGPYVYVGIDIPDAEKNRAFILSNGQKFAAELEKYRAANEPHLSKAKELLSEFYDNRDSVKDESKLTLRYFAKNPDYAMYRPASIECKKQRELENLNEEEKTECIKSAQDEMQSFTEFLKRKFFNSAEQTVSD